MPTETPKYEMTDEMMEMDNHLFHRIRALRDIPGVVKAGEKGGWIEKEYNLSQEGNCWADRSIIYGDAQLVGDLVLFGDGIIGPHHVVLGKYGMSINIHSERMELSNSQSEGCV